MRYHYQDLWLDSLARQRYWKRLQVRDERTGTDSLPSFPETTRPCCGRFRQWHTWLTLSPRYRLGLYTKGERQKEDEIELEKLTFGWSARCRLTWIRHLYLWRNSVPFCWPAENKWSFCRSLAVSLELTETLCSTEIGMSPSILRTQHMWWAFHPSPTSLLLTANFRPQPVFALNVTAVKQIIS